MATTIEPTSPSTLGTRRTASPLVWQGLRLGVPGEWSPVKIEGDFDKGFISLADLDRDRLGVRWQTVSAKADPVALVSTAMRNEVGQLAFDESIERQPDGDWSVARLYVEPEPPGRDVWIGYSHRTRRIVQVVYHAQRREPTLANAIIPTLRDEGVPGGLAATWSVFWLDVKLPQPMRLTGQRLNVGDLSLTFTTDGGPLIVRQLAAASVVLGRRTLESWVASIGEPKRYRTTDRGEPVTVRGWTGLRLWHARRRRLMLARWVPRAFVTYAVHDPEADRLALVRAPSDALAVAAITGIGRAGET